MPSAGRAFTAELITALVARGIGVSPIVLHAGVGSLETGELPTPEPFRAVGLWYRDFAQTTDAEVIALLDRAARELGTGGPAAPRSRSRPA